MATLERKDEDVFEDSDLKISGERDEIKLDRVLADYFVNSFHWIKG